MSNCCQPAEEEVRAIGACCHTGEEETREPGVATDENRFAMMWVKLGIALVLSGQSMVLGLGINRTPPEAFSQTYWILHGLLALSALIVFALLGVPLVKETFAQLRRKRLTVEVLFVLSLCGAFTGSMVATLTASHAVYYEVVVIVLVVYSLGRILNLQTRRKVFAEVEQLRQRFNWVTVESCCGQRRRVRLEEVDADSKVVVAPGEGIPVDGVILEGEGYVQEMALTGEPAPVVRRAGNRVMAGTFAVDAQLVVQPLSTGYNRQLDTILQTVEQARFVPSRLQVQADRLVQWFVPVIVSISTGTFLVWLFLANWSEALFNSMAVLLVACPCALGLATPLAIWSGLQRLSSMGIVARSGHFVDALARVSHCFFDKTGTLSEGKLHLRRVNVATGSPYNEEEVLAMLQAIERDQAHPIARAIQSETITDEAHASRFQVKSLQVVAGAGLKAEVEDTLTSTLGTVVVGERSLLPAPAKQVFDASLIPTEASGRQVVVAWNDQALANLEFSERLRIGSAELFRQLRGQGVQCSILTGDPNPRWQQIEGVQIEAGLTAEQKVTRVASARKEGAVVLFVGDGVNDAAAMAEADASMAVGEGAGLARSTAQAVFSGDRLIHLPAAIEIARRVRSGVYGNMLFAVVYNLVGVSMAALGKLDPVVAALLMFAASFTVSFRALRSTRKLSQKEISPVSQAA